MYGPEDTARRVTAWLALRIPARLRILEARLDVERPDTKPHRLSDPAQVLDHERGPIGLEDWPSVFVLPQELTASQLVDVLDGGAEEYLNTYRVQVLAWVRANGFEATSNLRLRYALAIREALLERKSLTLPSGTVVGDPDWDVSVDPRSLRESYSPLIDDEGRTIAGVTTNVAVTVRERVAPFNTYGPLAGVDVDVTADDTLALPAHPAFD